MLQGKLHFIFFQILLLAYSVQSLVLLTANMEDIKKVASKFVSDAVADKIAEFIAKAAGQLKDQVNDLEAGNFKDISDDNENYKVQNKDKKAREKRLKHGVKNHNRLRDIRNQQRSKTINDGLRIEPFDSMKYQHKKRKQSKEVTSESIVKNYHWKKSDNHLSNEEIDGLLKSNFYSRDKVKHSNGMKNEREREKNIRFSEEQPKKDYFIENNRNYRKTPSDIKEPEKFDFHKYFRSNRLEHDTLTVPVKDEPKLRSKHLNSSVENIETWSESDAISEIAERKPNVASFDLNLEYNSKTTKSVSKTTRLRGLRSLGTVELTTEKEKTGFDQYDNPNYHTKKY